jgi:hypothetical protein
MWSISRRSCVRSVGALVFGAVLLSAACQGSSDPLGAEDQTTDVSHAAGEGYIGPAAGKGNAGTSGGFLTGGGASGYLQQEGSASGTAAGGSTQSGAAAAPSPSPEAAH